MYSSRRGYKGKQYCHVRNRANPFASGVGASMFATPPPSPRLVCHFVRAPHILVAIDVEPASVFPRHPILADVSLSADLYDGAEFE
jgi:hypothetical protein